MLRPETPPIVTPASPRQVNHLRCLHEFVESQTTYYAQCYRHMLDLQKQLGRCLLGSPGQPHLAGREPSPQLRKPHGTQGGWRAAGALWWTITLTLR